jgi:Family of unknown function (DUF6510)
MANNLADLLLGGDPTASLFQNIFASDITLAKLRCTACGLTSGVGSLSVHSVPSGAVLRCLGCGEALMTTARSEQGVWLKMTAAYCLQY